MQFVGLKIAGFKSFVDPVEVPIEPGLTGVVGPNGCGKSNLLEALRWVMGATSARAMRGGEMDDLIFSGSEARPAREVAEVSLLLDNADRTAPSDLNDTDEIEVRRTLRRGAGSAYRINGRSVRAKDVQLLFADASTGSNSPALVRQGQISELIGSKPENRRRILEEAAGIGGLAARRHEAELKLQAAEANLEQLSEIMVEIDRQAAALRRQAAKAIRYRTLSRDIQVLDAQLGAARWRQALNERDNVQKTLAALLTQEADAIEALARATTDALNVRNDLGPLKDRESEASARLGALKVQLARLEVEKDAAGGLLIRLEADVGRLETERRRLIDERDAALLRSTAARTELESLPAEDPDSLAAERLALQERTAAATSALSDVEKKIAARRAAAAAARAVAAAARQSAARERARADKLTSEITRLQDELQKQGSPAELLAALRRAEAASQTAENDLERATAEAAQTNIALEAARREDIDRAPTLEAASSRVKSLEAELSGLDRLLRDSGLRKFRAVMEDIDPRGLERALAAALDSDLDAPVDAASPSHWSERTGADGPPLPEGATPLNELVIAPVALTRRLRQCGLVASDAGDRLQIRLYPGQRLVSRDGDLWRWDGFIRRSEAPLQATEKLAQRARRREAAAELQQARAELDGALAEKQVRTLRRRELETASSDARAALAPATQRARLARESVLRAEQDLERLELKGLSLRDSVARLQGELAAAETAMTALSDPADEAPTPIDEAELEALEASVQALKLEELHAASARDNFALRHEQANRNRRNIERELDQAERRIREIDDRLSTCEAEGRRSQAALQDATPRMEELASRLAALVSGAHEADLRRREAGDACVLKEAELRAAESHERSAAERVSVQREKVARAEANLEAACRREAEVSDTIKTSFDCSLEELEDQVRTALDETQTQLSAPVDPAQIEQALARMRREREALGSVNMEADRELAEISGRLDRQTAERDDLTGAILRLRQGVNELNAEGRTRLLEAFRAVNSHFQSLFTALFEGGEAELRLTASEDPLDAGLEIYACPPGKRLGTLALMSGGEQALTATALIFAVFLSRPAPVCVLDEVDAPLDDANVDRFCRLLDEMRRRTATRFVVITHNAVTMSRMDRLFGVTMQERGVSRLVSVDLEAAERLAAA